MKTTVSSKGQIVVPAEFRRQDGIESGQEFEVERQGAGVYLLTAREPAKSQGLVDLLLSCPVKDWYVPVPSESSDRINPPDWCDRQTPTCKSSSHEPPVRRRVALSVILFERAAGQ